MGSGFSSESNEQILKVCGSIIACYYYERPAETEANRVGRLFTGSYEQSRLLLDIMLKEDKFVVKIDS